MEAWVPLLVLLVGSIATATLAGLVNDILAPIIPDRIGGTSLTGSRVVLWVVAGSSAYMWVSEVGYDPIGDLGVADGADDFYNIFGLIPMVEVADKFFNKRLLR